MTSMTRDEAFYAALQDIVPDADGSFSGMVQAAAAALGIEGMSMQEAMIAVLRVCLGRDDGGFPGLISEVPGGVLPTSHLRACGDDSIRVTENGTVRRTET